MPLHVPLDVLSVCPERRLPDTVGAPVLFGGLPETTAVTALVA